MRFVYSSHKTREQAEQALEDYFATGEVCEGEFPAIAARKRGNGKVRYCVEIEG